MHCTVATVVCMLQMLCIALSMLLCACTGRELDILSSWYIGSYRVTYAQAHVHCYLYAMTSFIHEVSCELTCPIHLRVCMHEGACGYSQSVMQFKPCEWTLPTRLTVWHPCIDLCTYYGGWQHINYSWFIVWNAEALVTEYKLTSQGSLLCKLSIGFGSCCSLCCVQSAQFSTKMYTPS